MDLTQTATVAAPDALATIGEQLHGAFVGHQWSLVIGFGLMMVVRAASMLQLLNWVPTERKRWVTAGLSLAGAVSTGLVAGAAWYSIVLSAIEVALVAVGSWEFTKPKPPPEAPRE